MARARSGGGTAFAAALVLVSVLFVLSMILAIVFYTQFERARVDETKAKKNLQIYVRQAQENLPEVVELKQNRKVPVVVQLLEQGKGLRQIINGKPASTRQEIDAELESLDLKDAVLIHEIKRLTEEMNAAEVRANKIQSDLTLALARGRELENEKTKIDQSYQKAADDLMTQIQGVQQQSKDYQEKVDTQRQQLETRIAELQQDRQKQANELNNQIRQQDEEILVLRRKLRELQQGEGPTGTATNPATQTDGRIVSIIDEDDLVYIDIGRHDHVLLGLNFEVFDARPGIYLDDQMVRGKATIEVINVLDQSSVCRIVRPQRGAMVNEGDLIANAIYDPNVTYKFFVFGDFDIDNTGMPSLSDRKRVESMIERWGGRLSTDLTYDVDFLVLGLQPALPEAPATEELDPRRIAELAARQQNFDAHQSLVDEAKSLSIPILNQNRFLALVGYYRR